MPQAAYPNRFVRLGLPLVGLVLALTLPSPALLGFVALAAYGAWAGITGGKGLGRMAVAWLFIVLGVFPLAISRADETMLIEVYGWGIDSNGIRLALTVGLRALAALGCMAVLLAMNPIYRLCAELRRLGVPRLFVELLELSYRHIHLLLEMGEQIRSAQLCRLGYGSPRAKVEHAGQLFAQSFVLAHSQAEMLYEGLLTRQHDEGGPIATPRSLSSGSSPLLSLEHITYAYGKRTALEDLSLNIFSGERIALLGANGAGKSTLMRLLAGLIREQSGQLQFAGRLLLMDSSALRLQRRHIALVMQRASHQLFCPSVEDEIAFGLRNIGLSGEALASKVEDVIRAYHLEDLRSLPPHLLSEGQQKWVSIAAVLALEPDIILLDEPTATLDAIYTQRVLALLDELSSRGKTVILSTHDMNLAYSWAERAVVLRRGRLLYDGGLSELFASDSLPAEAHIARPYGLPLPVEVQQGGGDYRLALYHSSHSTALVVGGGRGALRKVQTLTRAGLTVRILSPDLVPELAKMIAPPRLTWQATTYTEDALTPLPSLVVAATGDVELDRQICDQAMKRGALVANLSSTDEGNVQFAAQAYRAGVSLSVHTDYRLPEVAQAVRDRCLRAIDASWELDLRELARLRQADMESEAYTQLKEEILRQINDDRVNRD